MPKTRNFTLVDDVGADYDEDALFTQMWVQEWKDLNERFQPSDDPQNEAVTA